MPVGGEEDGTNARNGEDSGEEEEEEEENDELKADNAAAVGC